MIELIKVATLVLQLLLGWEPRFEQSKAPTGECFVDFYRTSGMMRVTLVDETGEESLNAIPNQFIKMDVDGKVYTTQVIKPRPDLSIQVQCN